MKKIISIVVILILLVVSAVGFKFRHTIKSEYKKLRRITKGGTVFDIRLADANSRKIYFLSDGLK